MKHHVLRILLACLLTTLPWIEGTNAYFTDTKTLGPITISAGCWTPPTVPVPQIPEDDVKYKTGSSWLNDRVFSWQTAHTSCDGTSIEYQFEIVNHKKSSPYYYQSEWTTSTSLPAPDLLDGKYLWRVRARTTAEHVSDFSSYVTFSIDRSGRPSLAPGSVLINEVMWMGSSVSSEDEWIELRNVTDTDIDISNWNIKGAVAGGSGHLEIPAHHTIPAHGYFVIANFAAVDSLSALATRVRIDYESRSLNLDDRYRSNGVLVLEDETGQEIDRTPTPSGNNWPAGLSEAESRRSMIRNDETLAWETCIDEICGSTDYWRNSGNFGTPGATNIGVVTPTARLDAGEDMTTVDLVIENLDGKTYATAEYTIRFDTDTVPQEIRGRLDVRQKQLATKSGIVLGTCSSDACTFASRIQHLRVEVEYLLN